MNSATIFKTYHGIKLHFTSGFNYVKYKHNVKGFDTAWSNQRAVNKKFVDRLGKKLHPNEVVPYFLSNFVRNMKKSGMNHISYFVENEPLCWETFEEWKKRTRNVVGIVQTDIKRNSDFFDEINSNMERESLISLLIHNKIYPETYIIFMHWMGWGTPNVHDVILWEHERMEKYSLFFTEELLNSVQKSTIETFI